jgi:hypothetical protein
MSANLLMLNPSIIEFPFIGFPKQLSEIENPSLSITLNDISSPVSSGRNLTLTCFHPITFLPSSNLIIYMLEHVTYQFPLKLAQSAQPSGRNSEFSTERPEFWSRGHFGGKHAPKEEFMPKHAVVQPFNRFSFAIHQWIQLN